LASYENDPVSLKDSAALVIGDVMGYDHFGAESTVSPPFSLEGFGIARWWPGGLRDRVYNDNSTVSRHAFSDRAPMDNLFFDICSCDDLKSAVERERVRLAGREGEWVAASYWPPTYPISCPGE
jgi:hypothetical protein